VDRDLAQLLDVSGSADETQKLLQALKERIERHILLEEQRMFSRAEELFGNRLLIDLADKMKNLSETRAHRSASR
jgi:hemerythrin-like domain-containing protein